MGANGKKITKNLWVRDPVRQGGKCGKNSLMGGVSITTLKIWGLFDRRHRKLERTNRKPKGLSRGGVRKNSKTGTYCHD